MLKSLSNMRNAVELNMEELEYISGGRMRRQAENDDLISVREKFLTKHQELCKSGKKMEAQKLHDQYYSTFMKWSEQIKSNGKCSQDVLFSELMKDYLS